jgi:Holliday junction DNA helicase RuvA
MIDFIAGMLVDKKPTKVVIENNGIGLTINVSLQTYSVLPERGMQAHLRTYLHVREDSMQLFGFASNQERQVFLSLISIAGVGPKLAQTILSGIQVGELIHAIQQGDTEKLTGIRGVGRKTAQRLMIELNEKFAQLGVMAEGKVDETPDRKISEVEEEALLALLSLGYKKQEAENALRRAQRNGKKITVEELIKNALQAI